MLILANGCRHTCVAGLASLQQMAIVVGLFSAFLSNAILARVAGGAGEIFWFQCSEHGAGCFGWKLLPAMAFLLGSMTIPESPRYLVFIGKHHQARKVFRKIGVAIPISWCGRSNKASRPNAVPDCQILLSPARDGSLRCSGWEWVWLLCSSWWALISSFSFDNLRKAAGAAEEWALRINVHRSGEHSRYHSRNHAGIDRISQTIAIDQMSFGMTLTLGAMAAVFAIVRRVSMNDAADICVAEGPRCRTRWANLYIVAFAMSWGPVDVGV